MGKRVSCHQERELLLPLLIATKKSLTQFKTSNKLEFTGSAFLQVSARVRKCPLHAADDTVHGRSGVCPGARLI